MLEVPSNAKSDKRSCVAVRRQKNRDDINANALLAEGNKNAYRMSRVVESRLWDRLALFNERQRRREGGGREEERGRVCVRERGSARGRAF